MSQIFIELYLDEDVNVLVADLIRSKGFLATDALSAETKRLEAIYQQKLNDLEELKKSILQKAFNGELTNR